jgi:hypothetical protein
VIDKRDTFALRRTVRPRHRATRRTAVLAAAVGEVAYARPDGGRSGAWASAGAIASGLAAASIGVLVTVLIATGSHSVPQIALAAKGPTVIRSAAAKVPSPAPRHVDRTHAARRPKHTPSHHVSAPPAEPAQPAASQPADTTAGTSAPAYSVPSSGLSYGNSGISFWQQLAERYGMTNWHRHTGQAGSHPWP